jgi:hypothetical protein
MALPDWMRGLKVKTIPIDQYGRKQFDMGTTSNIEYENKRDIARSAVNAYAQELLDQVKYDTEEEINTYIEDAGGIDDNAISIIASAVAEGVMPTGYYDAYIAWVGLDGYDRLDEYDIVEKDNVYSAVISILFDYSRDHAIDYAADQVLEDTRE